MTHASARRWSLAALAAATVLLAGGCAGPGHPARPAASPRTASPAAQAVLSPARRRELASAYRAIAVAGNRRLETDFDGLAERDWNHLAAARADLRDAAATERRFDRRLLRLPLPPGLAAYARFLVWANTARAALTSAASRSRSVRQLAAYRPRLDTANLPVEQAVAIIRRRLGLPPPETS